jgi:hypothetical protein
MAVAQASLFIPSISTVAVAENYLPTDEDC